MCASNHRLHTDIGRMKISGVTRQIVGQRNFSAVDECKSTNVRITFTIAKENAVQTILIRVRQ